MTDLAEGLLMTRQAVTKHLAVLETAGLLRRHATGRERMHVLQDEPLKELEDWLAPYERAWDDRLSRLRKHLNEEEADVR